MQNKPTEVVFLGGDCVINQKQLGSSTANERLAELEITGRFLCTLTRDQALQTLEELQGVVVIPSLIENSPCALEELLDSRTESDRHERGRGKRNDRTTMPTVAL